MEQTRKIFENQMTIIRLEYQIAVLKIRKEYHKEISKIRKNDQSKTYIQNSESNKSLQSEKRSKKLDQFINDISIIFASLTISYYLIISNLI